MTKIEKKEDYRRLIAFCLSSVVVLFQTAVFAYVWYACYRPMIFEPFWRKGNWVLIGLYLMIYILLSRTFDGLRVGYQKKIDLFYSVLLSLLCTNGVTYLQITLINRWFLPPMPLVLMTMVQVAGSILWIFLSGIVYSWVFPARRLLVIHGDRDPQELIQKMNLRKDKYNVCAKVHIDEGEQEIHRMMRQYDGVIIWDLPSRIRNRYLKYCFSQSIRCYFCPKISDIMVEGSSRLHLFDTPLMYCRNTGLTVEQRAIKRFTDLVISSVSILLFCPLMLVIALIIKAYDGGPVLYRQERLTRGGKTFRILKFRSMCVDSEKSGARLASRQDDRITPVGKVLRNLHLDELPQLFNILAGDMTLVGPRPERRDIMRIYEKELPEFYYRLQVKAGLTGYAQVFGKYNTTPYDKLKLDLFYIQNYSYALDLRLLLMTVKIFFQKEVSEGVEEGEETALPKKEEQG